MVAVAALPLMLMLMAEEVATDANVLAPVAYKRPEAALMFEEVAIPPKERVGVAPPLEMIGQVPLTLVTPEKVEVEIKARPPVVLFQPSTCPPMPVP